MSTEPAARAVAPNLTATSTSEQYLTFALDQELFAIPILAVQEIRGLETVSRIPRSPSDVLGVMNLRGVVVPVVDLRRRLGIAPAGHTSTTVVILVRLAAAGAAAKAVGCVVDAVSDVAHIADSAVRPAPEACGRIESHFLKGVVEVDGRLVLLLDLGLLLGAGEAAGAARGAA
ncbi:MAG TPA: chemotaxis protein CheW [Steroidobacteraceae bacterium]|nr:chemotaxis protein CheW [Steroidobacteraceae bacterium]